MDTRTVHTLPVRPPPTTAAVHRRRMEQMRQDAESLAGAANLIANRFAQCLEHGGAANVQQQMAFITGAMARMQKDWGVVEHLQSNGSILKKPAMPSSSGR